jgi:FixJ family two-component response regulator
MELTAMTDSATVYIVDDDLELRAALRYLIESVGLEVVEFADGRSFLDAYDGCRPACFVIDMRMPGLSGLDLLDTLNARGIDVPVLMLTSFGDVPSASRAFKAGVVDFLEKPFNNQEVLDRVQQCLEIDRQRQDIEAHRAQVRARLKSLTPREAEVMNLVAAGRPNKQIAYEMGIALKTVEIHRAHVMEKLNANNAVELVTLLNSIQ